MIQMSSMNATLTAIAYLKINRVKILFYFISNYPYIYDMCTLMQMEAGDLEKPRRVVSRSSSRGSAIGGTGMRTLEKKNKALNNATKELEEKVKNLRERTVHRSLPKVGRIENLKSHC